MSYKIIPRQDFSVDFLHDCFPSISLLIPQSIESHLFPSSTRELCPTPIITVLDVDVAWPVLFPLCLIGVLTGLIGAYLISKQTAQNTNKSTKLYQTSFVYFAIMNASAFFCHSIFAVHTEYWYMAYRIDMCATSTSSYFLIIAALAERNYITSSQMKFVTLINAIYFPLAYTLMYFFNEVIPFIPEVLYIGVTASAAVVLTLLLVIPLLFQFLNKEESSSLKYLLLTVIGVSIFIIGPLLDRHLCVAFGGGVVNLDMISCAFFGCDLGFLGLLGYCLNGGIDRGRGRASENVGDNESEEKRVHGGRKKVM